jgi:hypothetical protein
MPRFTAQLLTDYAGHPHVFYSPVDGDSRRLLPGSFWCQIWCEPAGVYQSHSAITMPAPFPATPAGYTVEEALVAAVGVQYALRRMASSHRDPELRDFMGDVVVGLCAVTANEDGGESRQLIIDPDLFAVERLNAARAAQD